MQTIVNDNLDVGCAIIEKAATEKAIHEIDDHLMSGYQVCIAPPNSCIVF